jgi:uncharacterized membrane protein YpjA
MSVGAGWCGRDECAKTAFDWLCCCVELHIVFIPLVGVCWFGGRVTVCEFDVVMPGVLFHDFTTGIGDCHSRVVGTVWMKVNDVLNYFGWSIQVGVTPAVNMSSVSMTMRTTTVSIIVVIGVV